MVVCDDGQCLENYALEFDEIYYACYNNGYKSPHEIDHQNDAWAFRYAQNNLWHVYFDSLVAKQNISVTVQDNKENECEKIWNDRWMFEIDEGDGLACPWSFLSSCNEK